MKNLNRLIEVKVFEKAEDAFGDRTPKLDDIFCHPDRWRYVNCWQVEPGASVRMVGGEGDFPFPDGACENFCGMGRAEIVGEINEERYKESDRFEAVESAIA